MPYCRNCGSRLEENDRKCYECGQPTKDRLERPKNLVTCPRCESSSIGFVTVTTGSDIDAGSACCGYILLGPLGLLCGLSGGNKKTVTKRKCNQCGYEF